MANERAFIDFLPLFPEETEEAILARWIVWANEGLTSDDPRWIDTREGGMWRTTQVGSVREFARAYDSMTEVAAAAFPLWTWGTYLDDHAERDNLTRNAATESVGEVLFTGPAATMLPAGTSVIADAPEVGADTVDFAVSTGGTIPAAAAAPGGMSATVQNGGALTFSTTYRYVVTALDDAGETVASAEVNGVIAASGTNRQILVNWTDVPTATSYRVYRKTGAAGPPYDLLVEVTASEYTDTGAVAPNGAVHPPGANTTGGKLRLPVRAVLAGSAGNVSAAAISRMGVPIPGVAVTNELATTGGTDTEGDESLRERVLTEFAGSGGANKLFYERIARDYPGVGHATVIALWNGPGTVKIVVTAPDGTPVPQETIDGLQALVDPVPGQADGEAPAGAEVTVVTAAALNITITATIEMQSGASFATAEPTMQ